MHHSPHAHDLLISSMCGAQTFRKMQRSANVGEICNTRRGCEFVRRVFATMSALVDDAIRNRTWFLCEFIGLLLHGLLWTVHPILKLADFLVQLLCSPTCRAVHGDKAGLLVIFLASVRMFSAVVNITLTMKSASCSNCMGALSDAEDSVRFSSVQLSLLRWICVQ